MQHEHDAAGKSYKDTMKRVTLTLVLISLTIVGLGCAAPVFGPTPIAPADNPTAAPLPATSAPTSAPSSPVPQPTAQPAAATPTPVPNSSVLVNAKLNETFVLRLSQVGMVTDTPDQFGIRFFDVVSDSRCPQGVACIWEGEFRARITFVQSGIERPPVLELTTNPGDPRHTIPVDGYVVELVGVEPPAIAGQTIPPLSYAATFRVTRPDPTPTAVSKLTTGALDQPITLTMFQKVDFPQAQLTLALNGLLKESRCPRQVDCYSE